MNTIESMAAKYTELFGKEINKTELSIMLSDFTIRMQQAAIADKNFSECIAITDYSDKVKNAVVMPEKQLETA